MEFDIESFPQCSSRELHVWRVDLDHPAVAIGVLGEFLSPEERQRAARFLRDTDRQRFIVGHSALRTILGRYLGVSPGRVEITDRPDGKPQLLPSPTVSPLRFNLSHSEGLALVAVALDREVGIDVERVRPLADVENIVERYFAPGERGKWQALPDHERLAAFFRCWTRKEAYLKACGTGLSLGLDRFEVSFAPGEPARLLWCGDANDTSAQWIVYDVSPSRSYMAACVVEVGIEMVSIYDWPAFFASPRGRELAPSNLPAP
ncbi:MAG: 4'-phosphopantetheinyl transferase superfamily protein [Planctomycetaceae bacterium]